MSALAQCDAFAFIYDQAGDPAPDVLVVLKRVLDASGNPILLGPKTTLTDSAGSFHFTLPEAATAFISARATALWNCPEGRAFTVPPGPSGELVPDFSLPASTLVQPPLVYVGDVLSIPKASETQDGYLSAADYVAFAAGGAEVGVTQINTGTGLTGGPITETGTIGMATIPGVAGTWSNPTSITINAQGQIIAISATADTTAPIISAINATSITSSGATIIWTTDDFSDSQVDYGTTTSYGSTTALDATSVTSHSVPITGTAASTLYHYRVKSRNTAGLLTTSGDNTFTTSSGPDVTPPGINSVLVTGLTPSAATITWLTDEPADSQVDYGTTTSYGTSTAINPSLLTSHSVPLTGLAALTLYHFRVKSHDAASNLATSSDFTFTTLAPPDTTPPGISAVIATSITATGATITWTTNEVADSQVVYGTTTSYGTSFPTSPADTSPRVLNHTVVLTGLTPNTPYHYHVKSVDASSNLGDSLTSVGDSTFTTLVGGGGVDLLTGIVSYWKMDALIGGTYGHTPDVLGSNDLNVNLAVLATLTFPTSGLGLGSEARSSGGTVGGGDPSDTASLFATDNPTQHFAGSFSIAGWLTIHVADGTQIHTVLSKTDFGPEQAWVLAYNEYVNKWRLNVSASGSAEGTVLEIGAAPVVNTPYFLVAIYDAPNNQIRLSLDNGTPITTSFTGPVHNSTAAMRSLYPVAAGISNCSVDEVGLWGRVLTTDEITTLWNGSAGKTHPFS